MAHAEAMPFQEAVLGSTSPVALPSIHNHSCRDDLRSERGLQHHAMLVDSIRPSPLHLQRINADSNLRCRAPARRAALTPWISISYQASGFLLEIRAAVWLPVPDASLCRPSQLRVLLLKQRAPVVCLRPCLNAVPTRARETRPRWEFTLSHLRITPTPRASASWQVRHRTSHHRLHRWLRRPTNYCSAGGVRRQIPLPCNGMRRRSVNTAPQLEAASQRHCPNNEKK